MLLHWVKSLFKNELWVFIQPQRLVFMRIARPFGRGLKQHIVCKQVIDLPKNIAMRSLENQDWQILTNQLKNILSDSKWQNTMPTVMVSNHFARYTVIPWNSELILDVEREAYMQHCFTLAYGESAKAWDLRMSEPDFGKSAVASAINIGLLQALQGVFSEVNMPLNAVYPQLMLAINQTLNSIRKQSNAYSFWLIAIQNERVCLTLMIDGDWRLVKNMAIESDVVKQVTLLIQRETVNYCVHDALPIFLYWPESNDSQTSKFVNNNVIQILPHQFDMQNSQTSISLPDGLLI